MPSIRDSRRIPRVLIVEDTDLIGMLIADLVRECGCEVAGIASNTQQARAAVARRDYDAVLLDLGLDGTCSFDIADVLLELSVPFAFVTAYSPLFESRYQNVPVILKPFSGVLLIETVRRLVQWEDTLKRLSGRV